jgi:hypothetical protein
VHRSYPQPDCSDYVRVVSYTGNASQMAARWRKRADSLPRAMAVANKHVVDQTYIVAIKLSMGPETYAALRKAGYPYAVRNPTSQSSEIINVHDGSVLGGWSVRQSAYGGSLNVNMRVFNSSPWMNYLIGVSRPKSTMIRRPIDTAIIFFMRPVRLRAYRAAIFHALQ